MDPRGPSCFALSACKNYVAWHRMRFELLMLNLEVVMRDGFGSWSSAEAGLVKTVVDGAPVS